MVAAQPDGPMRLDGASKEPPQFFVVSEPFWIIISGGRDPVAKGVEDEPAQAKIASETHNAPVIDDGELLADVMRSGLARTKDTCSQAAVSDDGNFSP
jgi:hypothetical protein